MFGTHAHEGYSSLFVYLFICYQSTACVWYLCNKMNKPANFAPNSKGFHLRDFAKKLSFTSYNLFFIFSIVKSAIFHSQYRKLGVNPLRILLVVMSITIYGYRIQFIGHRANSIAQSVVATWQWRCLINAHHSSWSHVHLGSRLDHSLWSHLRIEWVAYIWSPSCRSFIVHKAKLGCHYASNRLTRSTSTYSRCCVYLSHFHCSIKNV